VTAGDGRAYVQGHFFGSGLAGDTKETIGASSSSKIWSNQTLTVAEFLSWVEQLDARLVGTAPFAQTQFDIVKAATTLRRIPDLVIAGAWAKAGFRTNPRVRFRTEGATRFDYKRLTDCELCEFAPQPSNGVLDFKVSFDQFSVMMRFCLGQGRMVVQRDDNIVIEVESATDSWMHLSDWLAEHPPVFYAADKSSFEGMNQMSASQLQVAVLAPGYAEVIDWNGCVITVEFVPNNGSANAAQLRQRLAGQTTVQEHLEQYLLQVSGLTSLFYDHRSGEAADYIAVTVSLQGEVEIALYHCKGAGGAPSGSRVGDVYEVAGQLVKSVYYCDLTTLLDHMEHRMHTRHTSPSKFIFGSLGNLKQLLQSTSATKQSFTVVGVQPGISRRQVDAHLADLMVFGVDYAKRGGATKAYWLVSE
jgi:hypothetical protein